MDKIKCENDFDEWNEIPIKRTNTEETARLQTPAERRPC
jgi:hypothetical protein